MSVKNADLADLIATTLNDLPHQEFEVGWDHIEYEACRIYQQDRMEIDGGNQIERKVMLDNTGNAKYCRLYDTDEPRVGDVVKTIKVSWTQLKTSYSWDKFEILRNKNSAKGFVNLLQTRRVDGLWALANLIEERFWKTPNSLTDDLFPNGVPYFLTAYTDGSGTVNTTAGFNGTYVKFQDATYSSVVSGIDGAVEAKWRNYCAPYTTINNDFARTCREAFMRTKFKVPLIINDPSKPINAAKRWYTDPTTVSKMMDFVDQKDDSHTGKDVLGNVRMDDTGLVFINRLPVVALDVLDNASLTPIYCVDFSKFRPVVHEGYWMEESEPMNGGTRQHTVFTVFLDGAHNNLCLNRRTTGFVIHKTS
jgi:hypothetical protein